MLRLGTSRRAFTAVKLDESIYAYDYPGWAIAVGYVASLGDTSVIMFRGTNPSEIQDSFINLSNRSRKVDHGNVHAGFWTGYDSLDHLYGTKAVESDGRNRRCLR